MQSRLEYIIEKISSRNVLHGKKIKKNTNKFDGDYINRAEIFLKKYETILYNNNKKLDYAIDCYLQMLADVNYESIQFVTTGNYSSKSFAEVNARVYSNPEVMEYYMHGLLLRQFLLPQNYNILLFFNKIIRDNCNKISKYLEVGGGHGLYISDAIDSIGNKAKYDLVDISQRSIEMAQTMIDNQNVNYILSDIFDYNPVLKYDFISMGEVLEHVEAPVRLLKKLFTTLYKANPVKAGFDFTSPVIVVNLFFLIVGGLTFIEYRRKKRMIWLDFLIFLSLGLAGLLLTFLCFYSTLEAQGI